MFASLRRALARRKPPVLFIDSSPSANSLRLLFLLDRQGPTFQINFARPFAKARTEGNVIFGILTERAAKHSALNNNSMLAQRTAEHLISAFQPDAIILSRYAGIGAMDIITAGRKYGIQCIFHLDDDLFAVPHHKTQIANKHADPKRIAALEEALSASDLAYISTSPLQQLLQAKNHLPEQVFVGSIASASEPLVAPTTLKKQLKFGYMGSRSHAEDLAMIAPAIRTILTKYPHAQFELFGSITPTPELEGLVSKRHAMLDDYDDFLKKLSELDWLFGLAPLRSSTFNACKTNTKWVEYTAAGVAVLASDHPVYQSVSTSGSCRPIKDDDWAIALEQAIEHPDSLTEMAKLAQQTLRANYSLSNMQRQVFNMLQKAGVSGDKFPR